MCWSRSINKLSLISKLKLFPSSDKMVKWLKLMLQSQIRKWSEIADCLTFLWRLFAKFLGSKSLKLKWLTISDGDVKMTFNLQYERVLSIEFFKCLN